MSDFLGMIKALLDFINGLGRPTRNALLQPLATVLLLLALYAGWHIQDEGSVARGLRVAFLDTRAGRAARDRDLEAAILRAELYQAAESDRLINQLLTALLQHSPHAARVRLGVIHNGVSGITGIGLLRYDMTNAVAAPGHSAGEIMQNQPLSDWSELLPKLLTGHCDMAEVAQMANLISRVRLQGMGATAVLACPVADIHGTLLGSVFVLWDVGDEPPQAEDMAALKEYAQRIGAQIAAALDLRVAKRPLGKKYPSCHLAGPCGKTPP